MVKAWIWLITAVLGTVALVTLLGVLMSFFVKPADAAPACLPPDPFARPVVRLTDGELRTLAALAWGEARSDGYCGMLSVSAVVINRMKRNPKFFGATITQVINKPQQFSVFGKTDPNWRKMARVDESDPSFILSVLAAISAISGNDPTLGSDHFYAGKPPYWADGMVLKTRIGAHTFMRSRMD